MTQEEIIAGNKLIAEFIGYEAKGKELWSHGETKIEAVWLAVVEFIKWYNSNKDNNG